MKLVDSKNQLWYEKDGEVIKIGFTSSFITQVVKDCWQVTAVSQRTKIKENSPLLTVETDEALFTVPSPVGGAIIRFNDKLLNFPDKVTEDEVIVEMGEKVPAGKAKKEIDPFAAGGGGAWPAGEVNIGFEDVQQAILGGRRVVAARVPRAVMPPQVAPEIAQLRQELARREAERLERLERLDQVERVAQQLEAVGVRQERADQWWDEANQRGEA